MFDTKQDLLESKFVINNYNYFFCIYSIADYNSFVYIEKVLQRIKNIKEERNEIYHQ